MKQQMEQRPTQRLAVQNPVPRVPQAVLQRSFIDNRPATARQNAMADMAANSPGAVAQRTRNQHFNQGQPTLVQQSRNVLIQARFDHAFAVPTGRQAQTPVQQVADRKIKRAITAKGISLDAVNTWQATTTLTDGEVKTLLDADLLPYAITQTAVRVNKFKTDGDLVGQLAAGKANALRQAEVAAAVPPPRTIVDEIEEAGIARLYGVILAAREAEADIRTFLQGARANKDAFLQCAAAKQNRIAQVEAMLVNNAARHNYAEGAVLGWGSFYGANVANSALTDTAHENNQAYVASWLSHQLTAASGIQLRQLVRFHVLLAGGGVQLAREKADVIYAGGAAGDRTGFLQYTFSDASIMKIHTHWNQTAKRIFSLHVQDAAGNNGIEINHWPGFDTVSAEVLAAQNRATPTTVPTGGALTF